MEQNKIRTYLLYAIGEIFLVVIGILIALQVNNWNEERKVDQERMVLLHSLKIDFESALGDVNEQIVNSEERSIVLQQLLSYSGGESINISDDSLKVMMQDAIRFYFFQNFSTTYEQAKSSGKLSLIRNEDLLRALSQNEENIKGLTSIDNPVFDESYSTFNTKIEIISMFDRLGDFDWTPPKHPEMFLEGSNLHQFVRSPQTYTRLYQIYYLNNLMSLWWGSTRVSIDAVLTEIDVSLNQ